MERYVNFLLKDIHDALRPEPEIPPDFDTFDHIYEVERMLESEPTKSLEDHFGNNSLIGLTSHSRTSHLHNSSTKWK